jgi:ligand-binding SRPBCC domain-containing protein
VRIHVLQREQQVPAALTRVVGFFSDAANLEALTPPWLRFRILSPLPIAMRPGARIEYRLRLAGVPFRWRTRIACWNPPEGFVDVQESGPYALWEHIHRFEPCGAGVRVRDHVRYALPFGPVGALAHAIAVQRILAAIFDYRRARVEERFGSCGGAR